MEATPFPAPPAAQAHIAPLQAGEQFATRYRLVRVIGHGGMGVVWLARDEVLERDLALKFLPAAVMHDRKAITDLRRETARALSLTHENIVRVYDFVEDPARGLGGIAMEFVDGENLNNLRADRAGLCFEPAELAPLVRQLCLAVEYAHEKGRVVHSDLKPANIMLNRKGVIKVADFGIARTICNSMSRALTVENPAGGTLQYMSPQQAQGALPLPSDDIYALGATLYDLLTGRPPFWTGGIFHQVLKSVPPSLTTRRRESGVNGAPLPKEWETAVALCLAKRPADRPGSVREVAVRLGLEKGAVPRSRRRRTAWVFGVLVTLAAVVIVITVKQTPERRGGIKTPPVRAGEPAQGSPAPGLGTLPKIAEAKAVEPAKPAVLPNSERPPSTDRVAELLAEGLVLRERDLPDDALTKIAEAQSLDPENPAVLAQLALTYERQSSPPRARAVWLKLDGAEAKAGIYQELARAKLYDLPILTVLSLLRIPKEKAKWIPVDHGRIDLTLPSSGPSLAPLQGLALRRLEVASNPDLTDLSAVAGMPLEYLRLRKCKVLSDLSPLTQCADLKELHLHESRVSNLTPLKGLLLRRFSNSDIPVLHDLSPLAGMPLEYLQVGNCRNLSDLSPLAGCQQLREIHLDFTAVTDLTPLSKLPLETLWLGGAKVDDLSPLRGMAVKRVYFDQTTVKDVSPLLDCPQLETVMLTPTVQNVEVLRQHPALRRISYQWDSAKEQPTRTAEEFWAEFDAKKAP